MFTSEKKKCVFSWSGGKDSALALYHCLQDPSLEIKFLLTTINDSFNRVSMHGVREELLKRQAAAIGIPLYIVRLPEMPDMADYEKIMDVHLAKFHQEGLTHCIFGDIFLEDLRSYREGKLKQQGFGTIFPLWKRPTRELINEFLSLGFRTTMVCVRSDLRKFSGREIDVSLLSELPAGVDVCGENGEFHTFVSDGPIFQVPLNIEIGETIFREYKAPLKQNDHPGRRDQKNETSGFWYTDILPV